MVQVHINTPFVKVEIKLVEWALGYNLVLDCSNSSPRNLTDLHSLAVLILLFNYI